MSKRPTPTASQKDAATLVKLLAQSPSAKELRDEIAQKNPSTRDGAIDSISSMSTRIRNALAARPAAQVVLRPDQALKANTNADLEIRIRGQKQARAENSHIPKAAAGKLISAAHLHATQEIQTTVDLGQLVKKAREKKGLTQQEFADLTGVGRRFVSELENGKPTIEFGKALKVAIGAGISLDVRLDGFDDPIGNLLRDEKGAMAFAYQSHYLDNPDAIPLSLSLPLTDVPYEDQRARPFFDNLLQERDGPLQKVIDREGLARSDVAGLLFHLGRDCPGSISVLPLGAPAAKVPGNFETDYRRLDAAQVTRIVHSLHRRQRLPDETEDPSPLAGVQSKIALTILPDGAFAEPLQGSGAPTTHIVKVPDQAHPNDPHLELEALRLSAALGFDTVEATVQEFDGVSALIIRRFDRSLDGENRIIRIHQEDFAQALGLPPSMKYERNGTEDRRFDAEAINRVLDATNDPAGEKRNFVAATLFDLMIGNVDAHAKNFALLYEPAGGVRGAPRYDLMPNRRDPDLTDLLPYTIGEATKLTEITEEDFSFFLRAFGIGAAGAQRRLRSGLTERISGALTDQLYHMDRNGMKRFADLIAHNIDELLTAFSLTVPDVIRQRDA